MKKVFMTLAAVLMGMTAANAQLVIGGNIGVGGEVGQSIYKDNVLVTKSPDKFELSIAPRVGYLLLDDKMEVGVALDLNYGLQTGHGAMTASTLSSYYFSSDAILQTNNHKAAVKTGKIETLSLYAAPYVRYFFLKKGLFSLGIQGKLGLGGSFNMVPKAYAYEGQTEFYNLMKGEYDYSDVEFTQEDADELNKQAKEDYANTDSKLFHYGIYVAPVMKFDLTEHCYMDITLNAIGLYAYGSVYSYKEEVLLSEEFVTKKVNNFAGGFTGLSQGSAISVGFAYKF